MTQDKKYQLIAEWKKLLDNNVISYDEFEQEKKMLLDGGNSDSSESDEIVSLAIKSNDVNEQLPTNILTSNDSDDVESIKEGGKSNGTVPHQSQEEILNSGADLVKVSNSDDDLKEVKSKKNNTRRLILLVVCSLVIIAAFFVVKAFRDARLEKELSEISPAMDSTIVPTIESNSLSNETGATDSTLGLTDSTVPAPESNTSQLGNGTNPEEQWNVFFQSLMKAIDKKDLNTLVSMTKSDFEATGDILPAKDWWTGVFNNVSTDDNYREVKKKMEMGVRNVELLHSTTPAKCSGQGETGDFIFKYENGKWMLIGQFGD
ncbi:MAG: hypothetical protein DI598_14310 [Pseudopedobacter saltans]|uniref:SHOCT domain-containing protein n=1 Tax=Pseudopedobacter saltans TaxID=151895 RepID=A0A2W5EMR3_9SPHI|nr:MAG: hypothetical protein DI598_14310 [Pseudopedobacter saltans]